MSIRSSYTLGFLTICLLLGISIWLQVYDGFQPCPLCALQRIGFAALGICFFLGILLCRQKTIKNTLNALISLSALIGVGLAGRQVWLQHYPTSAGDECGVSLQYMLQALPLNEAAQKIFQGTAECAEKGWEFMFFNMAEWSLIWFVAFFGFSIYLWYKKR